MNVRHALANRASPAHRACLETLQDWTPIDEDLADHERLQIALNFLHLGVGHRRKQGLAHDRHGGRTVRILELLLGLGHGQPADQVRDIARFARGDARESGLGGGNDLAKNGFAGGTCS